jgi:hypothetical protein
MVNKSYDSVATLFKKISMPKEMHPSSLIYCEGVQWTKSYMNSEHWQLSVHVVQQVPLG